MGRARALVLVVTGCYQPAPAVGVECSPLGECPTGQECVAGTCRPAGFEPEPDTALVDARVDAPIAIDAPADALMLGPWGTPTVVPGVDSASSEGDPSLTANRLTICFTSDRDGNDDLFLGTRATTADPFTVTALTALNTASLERSCEIAADGSRLVFVSNRGGNNDIFLSINQGGAFQPPTIVAELSTALSENDIAISPDGLTAVLSRANEPFIATRASPTGTFTTPILVPELDLGNVAAPSLTDDAAVVYLHSGATRDLFVATRAGQTFTTPVPITELNTAGRDAAPFVSADDRTLTYERAGVIVEATR